MTGLVALSGGPVSGWEQGARTGEGGLGPVKNPVLLHSACSGGSSRLGIEPKTPSNVEDEMRALHEKSPTLRAATSTPSAMQRVLKPEFDHQIPEILVPKQEYRTKSLESHPLRCTACPPQSRQRKGWRRWGRRHQQEQVRVARSCCLERAWQQPGSPLEVRGGSCQGLRGRRNSAGGAVASPVGGGLGRGSGARAIHIDAAGTSVSAGSPF
jgi:hypothetical protein